MIRERIPCRAFVRENFDRDLDKWGAIKAKNMENPIRVVRSKRRTRRVHTPRYPTVGLKVAVLVPGRLGP